MTRTGHIRAADGRSCGGATAHQTHLGSMADGSGQIGSLRTEGRVCDIAARSLRCWRVIYASVSRVGKVARVVSRGGHWLVRRRVAHVHVGHGSGALSACGYCIPRLLAARMSSLHALPECLRRVHSGAQRPQEPALVA